MSAAAFCKLLAVVAVRWAGSEVVGGLPQLCADLVRLFVRMADGLVSLMFLLSRERKQVSCTPLYAVMNFRAAPSDGHPDTTGGQHDHAASTQ